MDVSIHWCQNIRLQSTYKDNCNSVTLAIKSVKGEFTLTLYDLPAEVTDKLEVFRDEQTGEF